MTYDLILKGGHVIDPKNQIDAIMDVAIKDSRLKQKVADERYHLTRSG